MTPHPGNHILPHYDLALNNIQTRVNCVCESLLDHMAVLEHVISDADMNGANGIIADDELLDEETRQILSLCSAVLIQFHPLGSDLRLVLSLSRCTDKLRECAEEVADIARHAKASIKRQESLAPDIVLPLLNMAVSEFRDAVESLKTQDMETAREVRLRDKKLDKAHRKPWAASSLRRQRNNNPSTSTCSSSSAPSSASETSPKPSPPPSSS